MTYAQIAAGQKLHLVYEPGEGPDPTQLVPANQLSKPLCGRAVERYSMTINVTLANACRNCLRVFAARHGRQPEQEVTQDGSSAQTE